MNAVAALLVPPSLVAIGEEEEKAGARGWCEISV